MSVMNVNCTSQVNYWRRFGKKIGSNVESPCCSISSVSNKSRLCRSVKGFILWTFVASWLPDMFDSLLCVDPASPIVCIGYSISRYFTYSFAHINYSGNTNWLLQSFFIEIQNRRTEQLERHSS